MMTIKTMLVGRSLMALAAGSMMLAASAAIAAETPAEPAAAPAQEHFQVQRQEWTFGGMFGYFDEQQLRRGYKIYKNVCSNCHNMRFIAYRNLGDVGGPHLSKEEVAALAAEFKSRTAITIRASPHFAPASRRIIFSGALRMSRKPEPPSITRSRRISQSWRRLVRLSAK